MRLHLLGNRYAVPGTAQGSEVCEEVAIEINDLFARRNVPYRIRADLGLHWHGDKRTHDLVTEPALQSLADSRLTGARAEFEAALAHLRAGTTKDLEDAIEEAAKAVESAMKVVLDERGVQRDPKDTAQPLFNRLREAAVVPNHLQDLVLAASRIRNAEAGHGAGGTPRVTEEATAVATVSAAATALSFLASKLR